MRVHAVLTGPVDTDMSRGLDIPKASPESVARAIFDGVEKGEEEIYPDPMSESMAESWRSGAAKALERQNAALVQAEPGALERNALRNWLCWVPQGALDWRSFGRRLNTVIPRRHLFARRSDSSRFGIASPSSREIC